MSVLKSKDNCYFVLQPYRETLAIKNTSLLRKEVRFLSEQYGENVKLFKRKGIEIEAVFSKDHGVLFAEMVWQTFKQPEEMIYCEALEDSNEPDVVLVIVREGKIYLDAKLTFLELKQELSHLLIETKGRYQVYYQGAIPEEIFLNPAVKSLEKQSQKLLETLSLQSNLAQFQLLTLDHALDEQGLGIKHHSSLLIVTVICLSALILLWWWSSHHATKSIVQINPYQQFEIALQTPNPESQINSLIKNIEKVNEIRGWYAGSVYYNGEIAQMPLHSMGGTATDLIMKSQALRMQINFSSQGAQIKFPTKLTSRGTPDHIVRSQEVIAIIIDRMMHVLPGKSVQINEAATNAVFTQTTVTINFKNISAPVLSLIGKNLNDLPVVLTSLTANISNGLYTGSLQLKVVGN